MRLNPVRPAIALATVLVFCLIHTAVARAAVIFNSFGPGDSYEINTAMSIGVSPGSDDRIQQGVAFTPSGSSFALDTIVFAAVDTFEDGLDFVDVALMTSTADGVPGSVLETFHFVDALGRFGQYNPPLVANSLLHPHLDEGSRYWVVASVPADSNTLVGWNWNSTGSGLVTYKINDGPWQVVTASNPGVMRITGTPIPEPGVSTLVGAAAVYFTCGRASRGCRRGRSTAITLCTGWAHSC